MTAILILTGAGISAESGLGTFRSRDGLWEKYDLTKVATPQAFARDPQMVHDFYNLRRRACLHATPNAAHVALAQLQAEWPGEVRIATQNVDDLHERAGARGVLHMHGELLRARCAACGHRWAAPEVMSTEDHCPRCDRPAVRPDVVWFGEMPYHMDEIEKGARTSDLLVVIGSSGQVYPAAGLAGTARRAGAKTIEINLEVTGGSFDKGFYGRASEKVAEWIASLVSG
ncbi:MAG: NAD-dependent deacylase [Pseudomonadota bacterium]